MLERGNPTSAPSSGPTPECFGSANGSCAELALMKEVIWHQNGSVLLIRAARVQSGVLDQCRLRSSGRSRVGASRTHSVSLLCRHTAA